jgi:hypothetical protein
MARLEGFGPLFFREGIRYGNSYRRPGGSSRRPPVIKKFPENTAAEPEMSFFSGVAAFLNPHYNKGETFCRKAGRRKGA